MDNNKLDTLLLETPLYKPTTFEPGDLPFIYLFVYGGQKIDCHCVQCSKDSVFLRNADYPTYHVGAGITAPADTYAKFSKVYGGLEHYANKTFNFEFHCTRNVNHKLFFTYYFTENSFIKIGQYPTIYDLSQQDLKKYRTVLTADKYTEFNRGIGLTTHGVGIGAFVYLRRVFEDLIYEAYAQAKVKDGLKDEDFFKLRMDEKISALKDYLPEFLVKNKVIYGILSKGVHELTDDECLSIFSPMKIGIELILDDKIEKKKKEEKIREAEKAIQQIGQGLSGGK
ncbi:MAG: hypothetical protein KF803_11445 [Cyclobacteriaceae bacterium]|nr:hypothetical protein [Cyclobacteriaceae bacterium]